MRQTACARRFQPAMIGGGTWEGANARHAAAGVHSAARRRGGAWPLAARAQQTAMPVVGFLNSESPTLFAYLARAFRQGLSESGYVEGENVTIEYRWASGRYDRLPALVADLIGRQVAVIAGEQSCAGYGGKGGDHHHSNRLRHRLDPVAAGLVASLARPGGNLTGVTSLTAEVGPKRLELLHELVPAATSIALLVNPAAVAIRRDHIDRPAGGGTHARAAGPCAACEHRTRL